MIKSTQPKTATNHHQDGPMTYLRLVQSVPQHKDPIFCPISMKKWTPKLGNRSYAVDAGRLRSMREICGQQ